LPSPLVGCVKRVVEALTAASGFRPGGHRSTKTFRRTSADELFEH
jgi:hypothetical protein